MIRTKHVKSCRVVGLCSIDARLMADAITAFMERARCRRARGKCEQRANCRINPVFRGILYHPKLLAALHCWAAPVAASISTRPSANRHR